MRQVNARQAFTGIAFADDKTGAARTNNICAATLANASFLKLDRNWTVPSDSQIRNSEKRDILNYHTFWYKFVLI